MMKNKQNRHILKDLEDICEESQMILYNVDFDHSRVMSNKCYRIFELNLKSSIEKIFLDTVLCLLYIGLYHNFYYIRYISI